MAVKFPKSEKYNFNKNLVKRHKLAGHLDRYLGTEVEEFEFKFKPKEEDHGFHPSGHCTPSVTDLYEMAYKNIPRPGIRLVPVKKDWGTAMLKTFMVGHFWHQLLQKAVVDLDLAKPEAIERRGIRGWGITPLETAEEQAVAHGTGQAYKPYHWATGSGDVAPCSIPEYGDYVVDYKTMSAMQFRTAGIPDWAAHKYEAQINIYMDFFEIDQGLILAINKDSPHDFKEFEFVRNQPLIDAIYEKWQFVSECLDQGEAPIDLDNEVFVLDGLFKGPIAQ